MESQYNRIQTSNPKKSCKNALEYCYKPWILSCNMCCPLEMNCFRYKCPLVPRWSLYWGSTVHSYQLTVEFPVKLITYFLLISPQSQLILLHAFQLTMTQQGDLIQTALLRKKAGPARKKPHPPCEMDINNNITFFFLPTFFSLVVTYIPHWYTWQNKNNSHYFGADDDQSIL